MRKEDIEVCKKVLSVFNKANFANLSAMDMLIFARHIETFGKVIYEREQDLLKEDPAQDTKDKAKKAK